MSGFFGKIWNVVKKVAPPVLGFALGGPVGAAIGGAAGSALRGGNLSQILQGAGYGYGGGSLLSSLAGPLSGIGGALQGPAASGAPLSGTFGVGDALKTAGNNILSGITSPISSLGNLVTGAGQGAGGSSFGGLSNILSAGGQFLTNKQSEDDLIKSQERNAAINAPFLKSGTDATNMLADRLGTSGNTGAAGYGDLTSRFTPGDLTQDPGYQFQLKQGTDALNRANAASGNLNSGAALKEAEQFGTGLADTTYNNAFQRWLQNNQQNYDVLSGQSTRGLVAADNAASTNNNIGTAKSNADQALGNTLSQMLSGSGAKKIIGYTADNKAIYA